MGAPVIVAKRKDQWCLAQHINPDVVGCSLRLPVQSKRFAASHGFHVEQYYCHRYFPVLAGIRFYPEAKWRGTPVHVAMWSWGQADPRPHVGCSVNLHEIDQQRWFGTTGLKHAELIAPCAELGWRVDLLDRSAYGAVPIDELELVEGPPTEGTF